MKTQVQVVPFQESKAVPSSFTFSIMPNVMVASVKLHSFFHHLRRITATHVELTPLGDYMY